MPGEGDQGGTADARLVAFLKNAAVIIGALGILAYAVLRTAYVQYYSEFRVMPEQAGFDKSTLLSAALVGPAIFFATFCIVAFLLLCLFAFLIRLPFKRNINYYDPTAPKGFSRARFKGAWLFVERWFWWVLLSVTVVGTAFISWDLVHLAKDSAARAIYEHQSLATRYLGWHDYSLPVLEIQSIPAEIDWIGSGPVPSALKDKRPPPAGVTWTKAQEEDAQVNECLMYLGETADTFLVYDELHGSTITFAKDDVVLELRTHISSLPTSCPPKALTPEEIAAGSAV